MWIVVQMDGGYSGEPMYVWQTFGPFASEEAANQWIRTRPYTVRSDLSAHEVLPH